jgi:ABC-type uncharacterized transport system involved in gliding motility auxiliary subunit
MESELATVSALLGQLNDSINTHIKESTDERSRLAWVRQACKVAELLISYERNTDLRVRIERIEQFANELQEAYFDSLKRGYGTQPDRVT